MSTSPRQQCSTSPTESLTRSVPNLFAKCPEMYIACGEGLFGGRTESD
jgi:hypothetical protein